MPRADADWTISIYVPEGDARPAEAQRPDAAKEHSLGDWLGWSRVEEVNVGSVKEQWAHTIQTVLALGATTVDGDKSWQVAEIEVGLTLSAKGKLLFIAEAGAEASIKLKLTRREAAVRA